MPCVSSWLPRPAATRWQAGLRSLSVGATTGAYGGGSLGAPATILVDGLVGTGRWGVRLEDHGLLALPGAVVSGVGGVVVGGAMGTVGGAALGLLGYGLRPKRMTEGSFVAASVALGGVVGSVLGGTVAVAIFYAMLQILRVVGLLLKVLSSGIGTVPGLIAAVPAAGMAIYSFDPAAETKLAQARRAAEAAPKAPSSGEQLSEAWASLHDLLCRLPPQLQRTAWALGNHLLVTFGICEADAAPAPAPAPRPVPQRRRRRAYVWRPAAPVGGPAAPVDAPQQAP